MERVTLGAGFDCGRLEWQGNLCLLDATDHTPDRAMRTHYEILQSYGIRHVRDGLPWWHPIEPRLQVARDARMDVIWDLDHYWRHPAPTDYAKRLVMAVRRVCPDQPFRCCFNETMLADMMTPGQDRDTVVRIARQILAILRAGDVDVRLVTAEPGHSIHEIATHTPLADEASAIGLNYYPQHGAIGIGEALRALARRYPGKPLLVTETGLHPGLSRRWNGIDCKGAWLEHVLAEVAAVRADGVPVEGVYLYPIVNTPNWDDPRERWDHGLIRDGLEVDPALAAAILAHTRNARSKERA